MVFAHPYMLWLLVPALTAGLATYVFMRRATLGRALALALTRALCLAAVAVALARPLARWPGPGPATVVVADLSSSIAGGDLAMIANEIRSIRRDLAPVDELRVIAVASRAELLTDWAELDPPRVQALRDRLGGDSDAGRAETSLGDALRLAGAVIGTARPGRVVLMTDGLETRGDALGEARRLAGRGVPVHVSRLSPQIASLCLIEQVQVASAAAVGQSVLVRVALRALRPAEVVVQIWCDGQAVADSERLTLSRGLHEEALTVPLSKPGVSRLEVRLLSAQASPLDMASAALWTAPPSRVAVVAGIPADRTGAAVQSLLGASAAVRVIPPSALASDLLKEINLLVLSNVAAEQLPDAIQDRICTAVTEGLGLLITGGPSSFGPGGWADSRLARVLPVRLPQELERQDPSATAVFIIDTSGSMTGPRIGIAKEVVRLALRRLQAQDKAGIVEFYGSKRWAAPIQSAANHLDLNRALNRLTAGGGTVILPAIEEAEFALRNVNTRTRHVIILTDGGVESGPFEALSRRMSEAGITVSTVLVGPGQHSPFLASIAQWGRGRFYHAPDRFNLPEMILHQPQTNSPPPFVQTPTPLLAVGDDAALRGIDLSKAPPLGGYVRTQAKPTADALVRTGGGDTLLARWRYGRGRVATLATDLGSVWTSDFGRWPETSALVSNVCRSLYATPPAGRLVVRPIVRPAGLEVAIEALDGSESELAAPARVELYDRADVMQRSIVADPLSPGIWNVLLAEVPPGEYRIKVEIGGGDLTGNAALVASRGREIRSDEPDGQLLSQIEEVGRAPATSGSAAPRTGRGVSYVDLWPALVVGALVMLLLNVYIRRRPVRAARLAPANRRAIAAAAAMLALGPCAWRAHAQPAASAPSPATTQSATDALEAGDLPAAADALDRQATTRPTDSRLLGMLAAVQEMRGQDAAAAATLTQAVALEQDRTLRWGLAARRVCLLLDSDRREEALQGLNAALMADAPPATRRSAAMLAAAHAQHDLVLRLTDDAGGRKDAFELLLRGTSLLRTGQPEKASVCFAAALPLATQARDRRFIIERLIASARQSKQLPQLCDDWLADRALPADRLFPLLGVLRELGRSDDILALWKRSAGAAGTLEMITSPRFVAELVAAMREAGRLKDAETACRSMLESDPTNDRWLAALCRILVEQERSSEADEVLRKASASGVSATRVMRVAELARSLGRDDVAVEIAMESQRFGAAAHVGAMLFKAQVEAHLGQRSESIRTLEQAVALAGNDRKLIAAVAEAIEQSGNRGRAIELYRGAAGGGEDVLQRLAWLLEHDGQQQEAQKIWAQLWRSAGSSARRREAQNRLLDLASRNGTLADLAAELEERLSKGTASGEDLALLIDIYVGARDAASASEILNEYKNLAGGEKQALDQLAKLYLKCGRFGQADRVLRQLLEADPERAVDTLQEIAVLAIERNRPADAQAALEEIARRTGSAASTAELRAGVYEQLGRPLDAAREYRAAVQANPDQVEDWVLWAGAMNTANLKDRAVNRLLVLAMEADSDDLFTVAVDGLLNLEAPRPALRVARRYAIARVAQDGRKLIHYQLIRDLSEAMGDVPMALRAGELSLLVAGEQRTELIRELITLCKSAGQAQQGLELGRTLLALGDQVPPQVFLEVGKQLLQDGRFIEADGAFSRAEEVSGDDEIRTEIAKLYEGAGQMRLALGTLAPLLRLHPNDIELRCRAAGMYEQLGEHGPAFEHYLKALDLMLRRGTSGGAVAATAPSEPGRTARAVPRQGASMTEADQFLDGLVQGLIVCARSDQSRQKLLEVVRNSADQDLASSAPAESVPATCAQKAAVLRRFAFALHAPDVSDAFDQAVCARFPQDRAFAGNAVAARVEWGLLDRAAKLALATSVPLPAQVSLRQALSQLGAATPATQPVEPDLAAQLLPRLIVQAQLQTAATVLQLTERRLPRNPGSIPTLLTAALALNDPSNAEAWATIWLTRAESRKGGRPDAVDATDCVLTAWPALSLSARKNLLVRVAQLAEKAGKEDKPELAMLCVRMAVMLDEEPQARLRFAMEAASHPMASGDALSELVHSVIESDAPTVLKKAIESTPAARRRAVLLQMLGSTDVPLEGPLLAGFVELFTGSPAGNDPSRREQLASGSWSRNPAQAQALRGIVDVLAQEARGDSAANVALAHALATMGEQASADQRAAEAIASLTASPRARLDSRTLIDAVSILSTDAARRLLASASDQQAEASAQRGGGQLLLRALLLEHLGERDAATEALAEAFRAAPSDMDIRRLYTDRLESQLRWADLLDAFEPYRNDDTVVNQPQRFRIQKAYRELGRFEEAGALMLREEGPLKHLQRLQMAAQSKRTTELLPLFRSFHVDNRWERRSFTPYLLPSGGLSGLAEFTGRQTEGVSGRQSIYRLVAHLPWAPDELEAMFRSATPDASEVATLSAALADAAEDPIVLKRLIRELQRAVQSSSITTQDQALLAALVREGRSLPPELMAELGQSLLQTAPSDLTSLQRQAQVWRTAGDVSRVEAIERWYLAADVVLSRSISARARTTGILLESEVIKPLSRADRRLVDAAAPGPSGTVSDEDESERLARLAVLDAAAAEQAVEALRRQSLIAAASHPKLAMLWARLAAQRGDLAEFCKRASRALDVAPSRLLTARTPDVRQLLPEGASAEASAEAAKALSELLVQRAASRAREADVLCRSLCLIGDWCPDHGLNAQAASCLEAAIRLNQYGGEQQLWVADLARKLGREDLGEQIELSMLKRRALPIDRINGLLARVEKSSGAPLAVSLAREAARYCGPDVVDMARIPSTAPTP